MFIKKNIALFSAVVLLLALLTSGCDGRGTASTATPTPTPASAGLVVAEDSIPESLLDAPASGGDSVWIEFPFQGQTLPEGEITFVVYASSASGVGAINLAINGETLPAGSPTDLSKDGSGTVVRLEQVWQSTGPGEYILAAQAGGSTGSSITFCVVNCKGELELTPSDTPTPAPGPTETPTPAPAEIQFWAVPTTVKAGDCTTLHWKAPGATKITLDGRVVTNLDSYTECICAGNAYRLVVTYADGTTAERQTIVTVTGDCTQPDDPEIEPIMSFWANPAEISAGACTNLNWEVEGYSSVTLNGNPVGFAGTDEECPCPSETYTLTGTRADGTTENRTVTVNVTGSCDLPSTEPPLEPPPADTNGPEFEWTSLVWEGCTFYGQAQIKDPSGVSQAKFEFGVNYEGAKSLWMEHIGNGIWQSEVGISIGSDGMSTPMGGTIEYRMWAMDTLTNESYSIQKTETYDACTP